MAFIDNIRELANFQNWPWITKRFKIGPEPRVMSKHQINVRRKNRIASKIARKSRRRNRGG